MPAFTLRFANRSNPGAVQDWALGGAIHDAFQLQPDFVRSANININNNATIQIAVDTANTFAAANLTYVGANVPPWSLASNTPNEFALAQGGGIVTVRCVLTTAARAAQQKPAYTPAEPKHEVADPSA